MGLIDEEARVSTLLTKLEIEKTVYRLWPHCTPSKIARHIQGVDRALLGMNARWVCSIKQRIDRRKK